MNTNYVITGTFLSSFDEKTNIKTNCQYIYNPNKTTISYQENPTTNSKLENIRTNIYIINNNKIIINRKQHITSNNIINNIITIEKNKRTLSTYITPYGQLSMGITGYNLTINLTSNGGLISCTYDIDFNNQKSHSNTILLNISKS